MLQSKNTKELLQPHDILDCLWQQVGLDLMELNGKDYVVVVDYYSKYIKTCLLHDKTAPMAIFDLKSIFARHGIPEEMIADNVPHN